MKYFSNEQCHLINFDESELIMLEWKNEGRDIRVEIGWSGQLNNDEIIVHNDANLHFKFVTNLEVNFGFKNQSMGKLGIDKLLIVNNNDRWDVHIVFDFQPVGYIRFICDSLDFIVE